MFHIFNSKAGYTALAVRDVPCTAGQVSKRLAIENAFRTNQKYAAGLVAMLNVEAA